MNKDINSGNEIRKTDNGVKDSDIYIFDHQVKRPLSESEIEEAKRKARSKGGEDAS